VRDCGRALEQAQRLLVAAELDADLAEDAVGVALDEVEALFAQQLVKGYAPGDVGRRRPLGRLAPLPPAISSAAILAAAPATACPPLGGGWSRHALAP
jgi:hypothetical protein